MRSVWITSTTDTINSICVIDAVVYFFPGVFYICIIVYILYVVIVVIMFYVELYTGFFFALTDLLYNLPI